MAVLSLRSLSFVCCLLLIKNFTSQASAENNPQNYHYFCDHNNDRGNYTTNNTYHTNLNTLLSTLISNTEIDYGFYNFTYGENTDKVYAIGPAYFAWSLNNATQIEEFIKVVKDLRDGLRSKAASGDSRSKYAAASVRGPDNYRNIYGLLQCTPDLSGPKCDNCLVQSIKEVSNCCNSRLGVRIVRPSCNLKFETASLFYSPPAYAPPPSMSPSLLPPSSTATKNISSEDKGNASGTSSVDIIPLLLLLLCCFSFLFENAEAKEKLF